MASQVEVCNRALIKIGGKTITSITDDKPGAQVLSVLWDTVRKSELTKRYWNFALTRTSLPALATAPDWGFGVKYQLPVDFLRPVQINDIFIAPGMVDYRSMDDSPWAIEGQELLTDFRAPLKLRYVRDVVDPGEFDDLFVEVLASKLAYEGCYKITQSREGQRQATEDYKDAIAEAARANALSKPPQGIPDDSWVLGRL